MNIQSMLNPSAGLIQSSSPSTVLRSPSPEPVFSASSSDRPSSATPSDRQRSGSATPARLQPQSTSLMTATSNPIKYQPYEGDPGDGDLVDQIKARHEDFSVKTGGQIVKSTKRIPYTSDKRTLNAQTGLEALNVFHYTFEYSGRSWDVMWDRSVGLVRITSFFRALGHAKTVPRKALDRNKGLDAITHSITGGAIKAQGYWMPFEAARAVCITFCYRIRWALTPIFGYNFPAECLAPDHLEFESLRISEDIVQDCMQRMTELRDDSPFPRTFDETVGSSVQASAASKSNTDSPGPSPPHPKRTSLRIKRATKQLKDSDTYDWLEYRESPRRRYSSPVSPKTSPERSFNPVNTRAKKQRLETGVQRSAQVVLSERPASAKASPPQTQASPGKQGKRAKVPSPEGSPEFLTIAEHQRRLEETEENKKREAAEALLFMRYGNDWVNHLGS